MTEVSKEITLNELLARKPKLEDVFEHLDFQE